mgnify:CR=1 FL=1
MIESEAQSAALAAFLTRMPEVLSAASGGVVLFRAESGDYLAALGTSGVVHALQTYRPAAEALDRQGVTRITAPQGPYRLAVVFATKHKEEVLYHMALAVDSLEEGGHLLVIAANTLGSGSLERRCEELLGVVHSFSKHKCRVIQGVRREAELNRAQLDIWRQSGVLQRRVDTGLYSCPGLFSWKAIDVGSRLLSQSLPDGLTGCGADLGAGYGWLSREALIRCKGIVELHLVEAEQKALQAAELNLAPIAKDVRLHFHWLDVTAGLPFKGLDFVLMNPPFHAGRGALPSLGRAFVREALRVLRPGGRLFMVANRQLPYENEIEAMSGEIVSAELSQGFKVIIARRLA